MTTTLSPFTMDRYDSAMTLWRQCDGVGISESDSRPHIAYFLQRNPGLSFVALANDSLVGTILCGHDGRRGYIHHLAVHPDYRRRGIGRQLVAQSLSQLQKTGVLKCHLFVKADNAGGITFWRRVGWFSRPELNMMSIFLEEEFT
jgi:ribosomal protein S18 acetylase RimI-like enzyme